ncbi:MAG: phosphatase PAP2 family protein [Psychrobacter sp.]|uniref:phosphatase PAP2 family protein n=1 Tax=Psychrobacter TaxID=497 RepID=UPI000EDBF482|nr:MULTISPECIES: phosphatase PAP2 family protein [Psychrobacter]MCD6252170.1 phosphatase PAP2 family protein [Psychrobacter sp.]HCN17455.1 phosphoesterase [Psychrobacter sp.]
MDVENKKVGFLATILIVGLGIASLSIWLFSELAEELLENELRHFDNSIIRLFAAIETPTLDAVYVFITELGSVWFLTTLTVLILLWLWFKAKDKWGALFFLIAVGGNGALTWLLKQLYERERPSINEAVDAIGFSFPSGHSMGSLVFYGFITYLIVRSTQKKLVKILAFIFFSIIIVLIGTSRIYLGAHFPSDVIAGYLAGTIWLTLCLLALEWIQWQSHSQVNPVHALRDLLIASFGALKQKRDR